LAFGLARTVAAGVGVKAQDSEPPATPDDVTG
jgi:hypothetical protein